MLKLRSQARLVLDLPPSCIAFCPLRPQWAVVGSYFLDSEVDSAKKGDGKIQAVGGGETKTFQHRTGSLTLVDISDGAIQIIETLKTRFAVFDIHFCPSSYGEHEILGVAGSTGDFAVYQIDCATASMQSMGASRIQLRRLWPLYRTNGALITYFCWHPRLRNTAALTLSTGEVRLCKLGSWHEPGFWPSDKYMIDDDVKVIEHELEAWFVAFSEDGLIMYSGADDRALCCTRLSELTELPNEAGPANDRSDGTLNELVNESRPITRDTRIHRAGVTVVSPLQDDVVLTGSYDDHLRVISFPEYGRRMVMAEENLGGGVWRLEIMKDELIMGSKRWTVLASCMHAGAKILQIENSAQGVWTITTVAVFEEHESMNYGAIVQPCRLDNDDPIEVTRSVLSISFYDRLLCMWKAPETL